MEAKAMVRHARRFVPALSAMTLLLLAGWGCDSRPAVDTSTEEGTVKGTVYLRGKPVSGGTVYFDPANYKRKDVAARKATINKDGTYTITTLVGANMVHVSGMEVEKAGEAYTNFDYEVKAGENSWDIRLPKEQ
jgi:hypothetical protein